MTARHNAELTAAYAVCRDIAQRQAKNFYYGFLPLPMGKRNAMCALYAFMRRADDISDDESMPLDERRALMRRWLAAWHSGEAFDSKDRPVFLAVRDVQQRFGVPDDLLDQLVAGTTMDLETEPLPGVRRTVIEGRTVDVYQTFAALQGYCYLVASVVGLATIRVFGYNDPAADQYAIDLGLAFQLTNILRDVREDAERGRVYLPEDMLGRHGLSATDVLYAAKTGEDSPALTAVLAEVAERAERLFGAADRLIPMLSPETRPSMRVLVNIYHLLLKKIVARGFPAFHERVRVSRVRKLSVLAAGMARSLTARSAGSPQ